MISAVIVAGGKGARMGLNINKQYFKICDKEILAITLETFNKLKLIDEIVLVVREEEINYCKENIVNKYKLDKVKKVIMGGEERQQSAYNGLKSCNVKTEIVLIHDGARPFVTEKIINDSIECARTHGACTVAIKVKDTIKNVNKDKSVVDTLNRSNLVAIQTPQTFKYDLILKAHEEGIKNNLNVTDDTMFVEALKKTVKIVEGSYFNIKLTTPEDLILGKAIYEHMKNLEGKKL
jgi:2-C-methyl-D-erythritol 4-phosphate cytidylyltransferase